MIKAKGKASSKSCLGDMWEISSTSQIVSLLYALLVGIALSVFFDFFRAARKQKSYSKTAVFFQDMAFWVVATFITFLLFMARSNGEVRLYILLFELGGFFVYRLTLSPFVLRFMLFILKGTGKIFSIYRGTVVHLADFLTVVLRKIRVLILKKVKKVVFKRKNS